MILVLPYSVLHASGSLLFCMVLVLPHYVLHNPGPLNSVLYGTGSPSLCHQKYKN
jgi:hypothetical protein